MRRIWWTRIDIKDIVIKFGLLVLVGILMIFVWACFGNAVYDRGYNWFFIQESIFPFLRGRL